MITDVSFGVLWAVWEAIVVSFKLSGRLAGLLMSFECCCRLPFVFIYPELGAQLVLLASLVCVDKVVSVAKCDSTYKIETAMSALMSCS